MCEDEKTCKATTKHMARTTQLCRPRAVPRAFRRGTAGFDRAEGNRSLTEQLPLRLQAVYGTLIISCEACRLMQAATDSTALPVRGRNLGAMPTERSYKSNEPKKTTRRAPRAASLPGPYQCGPQNPPCAPLGVPDARHTAPQGAQRSGGALQHPPTSTHRTSQRPAPGQEGK